MEVEEPTELIEDENDEKTEVLKEIMGLEAHEYHFDELIGQETNENHFDDDAFEDDDYEKNDEAPDAGLALHTHAMSREGGHTLLKPLIDVGEGT